MNDTNDSGAPAVMPDHAQDAFIKAANADAKATTPAAVTPPYKGYVKAMKEWDGISTKTQRPWKKLSICVGPADAWMDVFLNKYTPAAVATLKKGDDVLVTFTSKGRFKTIVAIEVIAKPNG